MAEEHKKKTIKKTAKKSVRPKKPKAETAKVAIQAAPTAVAAPAPQPVVPQQKVFSQPRKPRIPWPEGTKYYGTGRRKESMAKVYLAAGSGEFIINGKSLQQYFCGRKVLECRINRPLEVAKAAGRYAIYVQLKGGGVSAQADAIRMGIARALVVINPELKTALKREGLLTRDPRMKERKKYGLKRARRAFQYTKR